MKKKKLTELEILGEQLAIEFLDSNGIGENVYEFINMIKNINKHPLLYSYIKKCLVDNELLTMRLNGCNAITNKYALRVKTGILNDIPCYEYDPQLFDDIDAAEKYAMSNNSELSQHPFCKFKKYEIEEI
jgi:hypothetical protein